MKKYTLENIKNFGYIVTLTIIVLYCFIAFLPLPTAIQGELDPSWQYAMSRTAADGLIFGKDVIFTGGPLAYLIYGAPLEKNLFIITSFRVLVHLALFVIVIIRIVRLEKLIQKLSLSLSVFIAYWIGMYPSHESLFSFTTDYQILFIFLIFLSFDSISKKFLRLWSLGLGALAGFCLLTKFTLGIYILGSLILFLLANLYNSIKSKSGLTISIFAIINSLLAAISISFIFLAPAYFIPNFNKILIGLSVSVIFGAFTWLIQRRVNSHNQNQSEEETANRFKVKILPWTIFYLVYSICLLIIIANSFPTWTDYLKHSYEVVSGYSSVMAIVGPPLYLGLALSVLFVISIQIIFLARQGSINLAIVLLFNLALSFKHGFVRQDDHILLFAVATPLFSALCVSKIRKFRFQKIAYFLNCYVLIIALIFQMQSKGRIINYRVGPSHVVNNLSYLFNFNSFDSSVKQKSLSNLSQVKLPENVTNLVKGKTIDVIPWDLSLVEANQLNWQPSPTLQSITAYTKTLDNINFENFSTKSRDYIFYNFKTIDKRHPFFDQPKTFAYIFCNYEPSSEIREFINIPKLANIILLEKRKLSRCSPISSGETLSIPWGSSQSIETTNEAIIRAKVKFQYSLVGKLTKAIFRVPPIRITVNYADGSSHKYRMIPDNSENGIIVSHLPRNDREALSFLQGKLLGNVQSFSFKNRNPLLYKSTIEISFLSETISSD